MDSLLETIMDPVTGLRLFFLSAAGVVLLCNSVPALRDRFVVYGSRASSKPKIEKDEDDATKRKDEEVKEEATGLLDRLATYQVPHSWFLHFYLFSVACSAFWIWQLNSHGSALDFLERLSPARGIESAKVSADGLTIQRASMSTYQANLSLGLLLFQGLRRLYESSTLSKSSTSQMWIVHWALGLAFYGAMNIAVWIEALRMSPVSSNSSPLLSKLGGYHRGFLWGLTPSDINNIEIYKLLEGLGIGERYGAIIQLINAFVTMINVIVRGFAASLLSAPSRVSTSAHDTESLMIELLPPPWALRPLMIFLAASFAQNRAHKYLASLPKNPYRLPNHPLFDHTLTPHYLAECIIYSCIAAIAAPEGSMINWTVLCGAVFVVVNLGVTARGTREWYVRTFGAQRVGQRAAMIPSVF